MTIDRISGGWGGTGIEQTQASAARGRFRAVHAAASGYLGLSADELRGRLANGQSLAQVAEASGKSVHGLTQAIANAITKAQPWLVVRIVFWPLAALVNTALQLGQLLEAVWVFG